MRTVTCRWADRTHKLKLGLSSLLCKQEIRASQRGDRLQNLKPLPPRRQVPSAKNADAILTPWKSQIFIKVRSQVRLLATWSSPNGSLQDGVLHSYRTVPVEGPTLWTIAPSLFQKAMIRIFEPVLHNALVYTMSYCSQRHLENIGSFYKNLSSQEVRSDALRKEVHSNHYKH